MTDVAAASAIRPSTTTASKARVRIAASVAPVVTGGSDNRPPSCRAVVAGRLRLDDHFGTIERLLRPSPRGTTVMTATTPGTMQVMTVYPCMLIPDLPPRPAKEKTAASRTRLCRQAGATSDSRPTVRNRTARSATRCRLSSAITGNRPQSAALLSNWLEP